MKHIKIDHSKSRVRPDHVLRPAVICAIIKYFKAIWRKNLRDAQPQPGAAHALACTMDAHYP